MNKKTPFNISIVKKFLSFKNVSAQMWCTETIVVLVILNQQFNQLCCFGLDYTEGSKKKH